MITINVKTNGQRLSIDGTNKFYCGGNMPVYIKYTLDEKWEGYDKYLATVHRYDGQRELYELDEENRILIPASIRQSPGPLYTGLVANKFDSRGDITHRQTSEEIIIRVREGLVVDIDELFRDRD